MRGGSFAVESAAAFAWNRWQACYGISGSFRVERVAALPWNQWQDSPGIGGSFAVEYAAGTAETGLDWPLLNPGHEGGLLRRGQFRRSTSRLAVGLALEPIATKYADPCGDGLLMHV
jgi:hypothetical protein